MLSIFHTTFPFFALVATGYLAARRGFLPSTAVPALNTFVLYFALPCMLYRFGASSPIGQLLDASVAAVWLLCALVMVGFTIAMTRSARINWNDASFGALVAAFPNTGFMGLPLLLALIGARAAGPVIITIAIDMVITSSLCIALSRMDDAGANGVRAALKNAIKSIAANPMPWAIVLGVIASAAEFGLPGPIDRTIELLANAASPVALFTIGAVLARSPATGATSLRLSDYVPVALFKLVLHPLLVLLVGAAAIRLGMPLDPFAYMVLILVASLPSASNVALLAERFGANNERVARIIMVSTVLSFLSFAGVVRLLVG
ncbi:MAG TPA: AEC family transporter [Noviherbaspirillum sp.]|nr:AEC family transporter [Noviherbaspirillum sp.]